MTEGMRDTILTIFDEGISKNKAIQNICKMYDMPRDEVMELLKENDRQVPYERKPKPAPSKEGEEMRAAAAVITAKAAAQGEPPVANYIYEVLAEKMDELDQEIRALDEKRKFYLDRYKTIAMYIQQSGL